MTSDVDGWKRVPVEPTPKMRAAGRDMLRDLSTEQLCTSDAADTYRAMLAATPSPAPVDLMERVEKALEGAAAYLEWGISGSAQRVGIAAATREVLTDLRKARGKG